MDHGPWTLSTSTRVAHTAVSTAMRGCAYEIPEPVLLSVLIGDTGGSTDERGWCATAHVQDAQLVPAPRDQRVPHCLRTR
eukprot:1158126-Rhodomonas_salina.2